MTTTPTSRWLTALATTALASAAFGQSAMPWNGPYAGVNVGDASSSTCNHWSLLGPTPGSAVPGMLDSRDCSKTSASVLGVQLGGNLQFRRLVVGAGADLEYWRTNRFNHATTYSGAFPSGNYTVTGRIGSDTFAIIGPRIGYAGDTWLPYVRAGEIFTAGSHDNELSYTPTRAKAATDSFDGGKNASSTTGWVAGGGFELGLNGAWSITAEYLHANLGKGSNFKSSCIGSAPTCVAFTGISFDDVHGGFSVNMIRVGITYWFDYWGP